MARLCLAGDMNGEKSARDVQSCSLFCMDRLARIWNIRQSKCWLELSISFSGSGVVFLKYGDTAEVVEPSTEVTFISHAGLFSFCCGNTVAVLWGPSPDFVITNLYQ